MYQSLVTLLFLIFRDPETVHRLAVFVLQILGVPIIRPITEWVTRVRGNELKQTLFGVTFQNPIGVAGGFDKNGRAELGLTALGFGFVETGTVTQHAQSGNPRPRIFRYPEDSAIINRMGFNNDGADEIALRLAERPDHFVPRGISLGKSKITELSHASEDYLYTFKKMYPFGDYFVINVSSPNTAGLRKLQDKEFLVEIVQKLNEYRNTREERKPLLVKIAPDLSYDAIDEVLEVCDGLKLDGIIATNTTVARDGLTSHTNEAGGMSGKPLRDKSTEIIRYIRIKNKTLPIIGVGGIFTAEDAYEKILAGANLLQIYTGFIYGGPLTVRRINKGLLTLLRNDGYSSIVDASGKNAT